MDKKLYQKLNLQDSQDVLILNSPKDYLLFFNDLPFSINIHTNTNKIKKFEFIHLFATTFDELVTSFDIAKECILHNGVIWISVIKRESKKKSDIDQKTIMLYGMSNGLIVHRVISMDNCWDGYKFKFRL